MNVNFSKNVPLFNGANSAETSTYTSSAHMVADYAQISVSIVSLAAAASRWTLQGSNDDGLRTPIVGWSTLSDIGQQGAYAVTPGIRWIRCLRSAIDSQGTTILQLRT